MITEPNASAQVVAHIAEYLRQEITDIAVREGQVIGEYALPIITVAATNSDNIGNDPDCAWKKITLQVSVLTSVFIDESDSNVAAIDPDAATNHAQTVGTVSALLQAYETMTVIETAQAQIFGWEPSGGQDLQVEKHFETAIIYEVSAAPWFAPE